MARAVKTFALELPRERALAACRTATAGIDWERVDGGSGELHGRQDPARLCCTSAPVSIEIALTGAGRERTAITLRAAVAGFGPIAGRDLRSAIATLEAAISRQT
jgi:hypothetical protein